MSDSSEHLEQLHAAIDDLVGALMYYDRKEDEDLPRGAIEQLVAEGHTSYSDIAERFKTALYRGAP